MGLLAPGLCSNFYRLLTHVLWGTKGSLCRDIFHSKPQSLHHCCCHQASLTEWTAYVGWYISVITWSHSSYYSLYLSCRCVLAHPSIFSPILTSDMSHCFIWSRANPFSMHESQPVLWDCASSPTGPLTSGLKSHVSPSWLIACHFLWKTDWALWTNGWNFRTIPIFPRRRLLHGWCPLLGNGLSDVAVWPMSCLCI